MSDRGVGIALLAIGAFLYAARYVAAAIFMSGVSSWSADLFDAALEHVGPWLIRLALASAILGCVFFVRGELDRRKSRGE